MEKIKKWSTNIIMVLVSIFIGTIVIELVNEWRSIYHWKQMNKKTKPYYQWSFYTSGGNRIGNTRGILKLMIHPVVGYVNFPNQKTQFFSINSRGFRGPEIRKNTVGFKRIILIGGSAAFGTGLDDNSESFAFQLEKKLGNVEVINAAVIGHRSGQELLYLFKELIDLKPDLVIAFDGWNDYWESDTPKWDEWFDINGANRIQYELSQLNSLIYTNFFNRCFNFYRVLYAKTIYSQGGIFNSIAQYFHGLFNSLKNSNHDSEFSSPQMLDTETVALRYSSNLIKMDRLTKQLGGNFLCMLQPVMSDPRTQKLKDNNTSSYIDFCNRVKKQIKQHDIDYVDLNNYSKTLTDHIFFDGVHLDERGNELLADIIGELILKENLIQFTTIQSKRYKGS